MSLSLNTMVLFLVFLLSNAANSQNEYILQATLGRGYTYHHNSPIDFLFTQDSDPNPKDQTSEWGNNIQLAFGKRLTRRYLLGMNVGFSELRFSEVGLIRAWGGIDIDYTARYCFKYLSIGLWNEFVVFEDDVQSVITGGVISLEHNRKSERYESFWSPYEFDFNKTRNYAARLSLAYIRKIYERLELMVQGEYMTGLNEYSSRYKYKPYSIGIEAGLRVKL